jgi:CheY-like chemotaxis protein
MQTKTILLVDDNAVQAAVRQAILKRNGYSVVTSLNPRRALEQIRSGDFLNEIHLVITDHIMPGMSGCDFIREIRSLRGAIPVLVISGLEEAAQEYDDLKVEFRMKPLQPEKLLECVQMLVGPPSESSDPVVPSATPVIA